jgi:hypothetical protein
MPGNDGPTIAATSDRVADLISPATYQGTASTSIIQRIVYTGDNSFTSYLGSNKWHTWNNFAAWDNSSGTCLFDLHSEDWTSNATTTYKCVKPYFQPWKIIWNNAQSAVIQRQVDLIDADMDMLHADVPMDPQDEEELLPGRRHGPQILVPTPRVNAQDDPIVTGDAQRRAAEQRAEALLCRFLNSEQLQEFKAHRRFHVRSASGRLFRIEWGWARNVRLIDEKTGAPVRGFCIHPRQNVPVADSLLAQKLMLEATENEFEQIANSFAV